MNTNDQNRPTEPNYCALCGHAPCLWLNYSTHYTDPQPYTIERHEHLEMMKRIDALTDSQRRDALMFLSGNVDMMNLAMKMVAR
jgi:hypothetical protein